jgi:hypothetical protein
MTLSDRQLATYLLEVREVVQLMLGRFGEIREISDRWVRAKDSEDGQLAVLDAGGDLDNDTWRTTLWNRGEFQAQYFAAVEAFLAGWARLSLLLFPVEGRGPLATFRAERGRRIREALGVAPDSVLSDRELRNSWMHFDERLDRAMLDGTFGERHRFLRAVEAPPFFGNTIALLEVDSMIVRYTSRSGQPAPLDLGILENALVDLRAALKHTIAG